MTKDQYLSHNEVRWVRNDLADMLSCGSLAHRYYHFDRRRQWSCRSVYNAAENYYFPIEDRRLQALWNTMHPDTPLNGSLFHTTAVLQELQCRLRSAVDEPDEAAALDTCDLILRWGGVMKGNRASLDHLHRADGGLVGYLRGARELLTADDDYSAREAQVAPGQVLFCTAGFTKIYSLLLDDFLIYDSRVAAALGMFIVHLCRVTNRQAVPHRLRFLWMPARARRDPDLNKYVANQRRNPGAGPFRFSTQRRRGAYLTHNIRAGWLLSDVTKRTVITDWPHKLIPADARCSADGACCARPHPPRLSALRALEAALFMIGYDLSGNGDYPANQFAPP